MSSAAVIQSNFLPWWGYFHLVASVDHLVFLDDVQFTRRDWRNRNRIKAPDGVRWLTIPVSTRGRYHARISETPVASPTWWTDAWSLIESSYRRAPGFEDMSGEVRELLGRAGHGMIHEVNRSLTASLLDLLGVKVELNGSEEFRLAQHPTDRLVGICQQLGVDSYVSGPSARQYLEEDRFAARGIAVDYFEYPAYPEYRQPHGGFAPGLSIIDLLLSEGDAAVPLFWSVLGGDSDAIR